MDGKAKTFRIPNTKSKDIVAEIRRILENWVPLKWYHGIIRNLCRLAIILPGTEGIFSMINKVFKGEPPIIVIGKSS